jgi:tetratricopeptide (TPR) repeat protein
MKYVIPGFGCLSFVLAVALAACVAGACLISCSGERDVRPPPTTRVADPSDIIDQELMIALAQAKNFHHKSKVYMADGNLTAATASVRQILSLHFPKAAPEADDVRNDARALLAKLLMSQGQLDEATRTIEEGLAASQRESFFVANLYTVQGELHEARAVGFDATGDAGKAAAIDERRAAIASYDRSIQINERLQKTLLEER